MSKYKAWELWWAHIQFDDSDEEKVRPVVILEDGTAFLLALYVTGASPRPFTKDYAIQDWQQAGLPKRSTIRLDRRYRLTQDKMEGKIGELSPRDRILVRHNL